jgi:hypothetical protein
MSPFKVRATVVALAASLGLVFTAVPASAAPSTTRGRTAAVQCFGIDIPLITPGGPIVICVPI